MRARMLAVDIASLILSGSPGETAVNPDTGERTERPFIELELDETRIGMANQRDVSVCVIEQWIDDHFVPSVLTGTGSGTRDHVKGSGYSLNVAPTARILVRITKKGFELAAVYVR